MNEQHIICRFYSCSYGCANKQFCELLDNLTKEEFVKKNPRKTVIEGEQKWYVIEKGPFLPTVDITSLISLYNEIVTLYNECIDHLNQHFMN